MTHSNDKEYEKEAHLTQGQVMLSLALLGLRRHPESSSPLSPTEMVLELPLVLDEVLEVVADELEQAMERRKHKSYNQFYEYKRTELKVTGLITPSFVKDGLYFRPTQDLLNAMLDAANKADRALSVLRHHRKIQSMMKADGVKDWDYDEGII